MAIANGTCVSFCNQPKANLASPGYAPGTIAVNVTWMKRGFNACQTHRIRSMFQLTIFNHFPVIQPVSSKVRHFSTFFAHFGLPWYAPWTITVNDTWMERRFNAGQTHIAAYTQYPSIFNRLRAYSEIAYWSEIATFFTPLAFNAPLGVFSLEFRGKV